MKVAHYISKYIESNDNLLWGYIGGFNADILNFFCENKKNHFILNYHEQASAFAINAYSICQERQESLQHQGRLGL